MIIMEEDDPQANLPILDFFGLDHTSDTPCFVLFCWDNEDNLLVTHYRFNASSVDTAYSLLYEVIEELTKSEAQILPEYRKDMGVYRQAREQIRFWHKVV